MGVPKASSAFGGYWYIPEGLGEEPAHFFEEGFLGIVIVHGWLATMVGWLAADWTFRVYNIAGWVAWERIFLNST